MVHGDNRGIVVPPVVAKNQIDILEIFGNKDANVSKVSKDLEKKLSRR
jgi:prolyl-tRNA synthetase